MDEPQKNAHLHQTEAWSIKDPNDKSVWHSQHMFIQPETVDAATVETYRNQHEMQAKALEEQQNAAKAESDRLEALGRKLWPSLIGNCPAVIIAEHHVSDCDSQSDYFASHEDQTVILAPSKHKRDLFPEMRKAAALIPETRHYADSPQGEDEHREKYSMGHGYYLGKSRYSGWQISKEVFYKGEPQREHFISLAKRHDHLQKTESPRPAPLAPTTDETSAAGWTITYDRDWTWVFFPTKPTPEVISGLKDSGARWSQRRAAWYFNRHVEQTELSQVLETTTEPETPSAPDIIAPATPDRPEKEPSQPPAFTFPSRFALLDD